MLLPTNKNESIAIIGMSCRFPNANEINEFWELLKNGRSPLREVPKDRWDVDQYYDPLPDKPGKMYVKQGYFLDQIDQFDPQFFRISPKEAATLDPQHRLLLEVSWEALENAKKSPHTLSNSQVGVFVGLMNHDYGDLISRHSKREEINFFAGLGNSHHCAAGRIAYTYGLQGPCLTLDTACSSSLVAIHAASTALFQQECTMAIVGAANVILDPHLMISMCHGKVLARDGRCKTFDKSADGYGRGEGCGVVILKRLSDAEKEGDPILAIIRASAVNQDGPSSGLTVPNGTAQRKLLQQALDKAGLQANEMDYLEAHGSATPLGDLVEMNSIAAILSKDRDPHHPLIISSVKPYIGHLEAASGIAGLIKVVLSLQNESIPRHLHLMELNPDFQLAAIPAIIPKEPMTWKRGQRKRIAGISGFGISGTNAHLIIEESPQITKHAFVTQQPYQRKRYFAQVLDQSHEKMKPLSHPLIGNRSPQIKSLSYQHQISLSEQAYLKDHQVFDAILFPLAGLIEAALAGVQYLIEPKNGMMVQEFVIENSLVLHQTQSPMMHVEINEITGGMESKGYEIAIYSSEDNHHNKKRHAMCKIIARHKAFSHRDLDELKQKWPKAASVDELYLSMRKLGLNYGSTMRPIESLWVGSGESLAKLKLPPELYDANYLCHPVLLDGVFQAAGLSMLLAHSFDLPCYLPMGVKQLHWHHSLSDNIYVYVRYPKTKSEFMEIDFEIYDMQGQLLVTIEGLYLKQVSKRDSRSYFYHESWQMIPPSESLKTPVKQYVLIGNPNQGGTELQRLLKINHHDVLLMDHASELKDEHFSRHTHLVYLNTLAIPSTFHLETTNQYLQTTCSDLLTLFQLLKDNFIAKMTIVTQGNQKIHTNDSVLPMQSAINGMIQCIRHEYPHLLIQGIDLDPNLTIQTAFETDLLNEFKFDTNETQIALRQGHRFGLRLKPLNLSSHSPVKLSGTYLITGGLGGLGLSIAKWLLQNGVKHIALVGRQAPKEAVLHELDELRKNGAHLIVFQADVSDFDQLHQVLKTIRSPDSGFAQLKGVIHAAGVLADAFISNQTWDHYQAVFAPKIAGAWHLHSLTQQEDLDHFILFSSVASIIGAEGQSNYGAANAFLDSLAAFRHQQGLPALSINWGPWSEVGMASGLAVFHKDKGIHPLSPETGAQLFGAALNRKDRSQIMIADIHWDQFIAQIPSTMKKHFSEMTSVPAERKKNSQQIKTNLADIIQSSLKSALGFDANDIIKEEINFFDLGMDSLSAMQFNEKLKNALQDEIEWPAVAIFQNPSIRNLLNYLEGRRISKEKIG